VIGDIDEDGLPPAGARGLDHAAQVVVDAADRGVVAVDPRLVRRRLAEVGQRRDAETGEGVAPRRRDVLAVVLVPGV
jgi:hypothetical protein